MLIDYKGGFTMLLKNATLTFRNVKQLDAERIQEIYRPYILHTNYNLDSELPSVEQLKNRINSTKSHLPFVVVECDNIVMGFAYISPFYHYALTNAGLLSIYVAEDCPIKGVGYQLLNTIENCLMDTDLEYIISSIVTDNQRSIRFHEKNGFEEMMYLPDFACKNGQFLDVVWMRKPLCKLVPILEIQPAVLQLTPFFKK